MVTATLARIGNEVLELQRPEIGELREPTTADVVGSITMPHKRNPERSEHLDTLARLVRAQAGVLLEGMVQLHERDGRAWKAEWVAFPEVCLLTGVALQTAIDLLAGLEVDAEAMAARVDAQSASEQVLAVLTARLGRHRAQEALHRALAPGARRRHQVAGRGRGRRRAAHGRRGGPGPRRARPGGRGGHGRRGGGPGPGGPGRGAPDVGRTDGGGPCARPPDR